MRLLALGLLATGTAAAVTDSEALSLANVLILAAVIVVLAIALANSTDARAQADQRAWDSNLRAAGLETELATARASALEDLDELATVARSSLAETSELAKRHNHAWKTSLSRAIAGIGEIATEPDRDRRVELSVSVMADMMAVLDEHAETGEEGREQAS